MAIIFKIIKALIKIAIGIVLLVILAVVGFAGYSDWCAYKPLMTKKFDSEQWKMAGIEREDGLHPLERRCGMYHDLTRNHLKKEMTIKEVEDLLGERVTWSYCKNQKIKCIRYSMGTCYANALSRYPMGLYTCFNREGKLVTYDRDEHCDSFGTYNTTTKKQYCIKAVPSGGARPTDQCGIDPW